MRHEFPSGDWVDITPVQDLKMKHRMKLAAVINANVPVNADDDPDMDAIRAMPGGVLAYNEAYRFRRLAIITALVVDAWSYDAPLPRIENGDLVSAESMDEADLELMDLLEPYREKLTREPDPKGTTTSASNGRSKAKAADLKA